MFERQWYLPERSLRRWGPVAGAVFDWLASSGCEPPSEFGTGERIRELELKGAADEPDEQAAGVEAAGGGTAAPPSSAMHSSLSSSMNRLGRCAKLVALLPSSSVSMSSIKLSGSIFEVVQGLMAEEPWLGPFWQRRHFLPS